MKMRVHLSGAVSNEAKIEKIIADDVVCNEIISLVEQQTFDKFLRWMNRKHKIFDAPLCGNIGHRICARRVQMVHEVEYFSLFYLHTRSMQSISYLHACARYRFPTTHFYLCNHCCAPEIEKRKKKPRRHDCDDENEEKKSKKHTHTHTRRNKQ